MMNLNLPYKIEYTPPYNDSNCFKCGKQLQQGQLRIAAMIQSKHHDGKDPLWHHKQCFFQQYLLTSYQEIENFEGIKYIHQTEILMHIDPSQTSKLLNILSKSAEDPCDALSANNFGIEYSTSNESLCKECNDTISYNEIRVKTTIYDSEIASKFGKEVQWHHLHCFVFSREQHNFCLSGEMLPGFNDLKEIHQQIVKDAIPSLDHVQNYKIQPFEQPSEQMETRTEKEFDMERTIASQTAKLFRSRQTLQIICSEDELKRFLNFNSSNIVDGLDNLLDRCADFLTFGALYKCQKCYEGDMIFTKYGYTCNGVTNEWIQCGHFDEKPLRLKCRIPDDMRLATYFSTSTLTIENRAVRPKNTVYNVNGIAAVFETLDIKSPRSVASKVNTIKIKDGSAVDEKSGLEFIAHVFCQDGVMYSTVLGLTDIQSNKNSYFKIQVLEADRVYNRKYWLFSSWGRIGTEIGHCKVEACKSYLDATEQFKKLYEKQTGNSWSNRSFKKVVGKFYPIDVNYTVKIEADYSIKSNLLPDVKELMKMLFNIEAMQLSMVDYFQLDLEKMPLEKLSNKQLQQASLTLVELENGIEAGTSEMELIGLSNKFFTLIPQNFGMEQVPIIDTIDKINAKRKIVDSLAEIERAYSIMVIEDLDRNINPYDAYYLHLKTDIQQLNQNANEHKLIETYVSRSQGFRVADIFTINRQGENVRYSPYRDLPNRRLLWHGTRVTNIASILINGLKIANIDHFYGRGIYFADVCIQSVSYCNSVGNVFLLILAEVASYQTHEGDVTPDPNEAHIRDDGVIIPIGRLREQGLLQRYTEYVAVDEAHVNIQYLVKVERC